jgi:hypothetical protein
MTDTYFDDARTMFMTDGWRTFQEELDEAITTCTLEACNSTEEFWEMRGRVKVLRQLAGYENALLAAEEQADA